MPELLPCPFCGSQAKAGQWNYSPMLRAQGDWEVRCMGCGASFSRSISLAVAVAAWNHRAPHPDTVLLNAIEAGGWHIDCALAGEPVCWTVCTWNESRNDFDTHSDPTPRAAIKRAIKETLK